MIELLIVICFSDCVHVFGGCSDSYLVDMETKIAAKWKRTFSLPLRLCTVMKKMERERMRGVTEGERRGEESLENYEGFFYVV